MGVLLVGPACAPNPPPEGSVSDSPQLALTETCPAGTRSNPELKSGRAARMTIQSAYPDSLQERGIGGKVSLWLLVLEDGRVGDVSIEASSGHPGLDSAAMSAGWRLEYRPACRSGGTAAVWLNQELVFKPES